MTARFSVVTAFKGTCYELLIFINSHICLLEAEIPVIIVDGSLSNLAALIDPRITYMHQPGSGLYAAINTGVRLIATEYYIVVGKDDCLYADSILRISPFLNGCDFISFPVRGGRTTLRSRPYPVHHMNYIYQHSASTFIKASLHSDHGFYDEHLSIAADFKFVIYCSLMNRSFSAHMEPCVGSYGLSGISSTRKALANYEMFIACIELSCLFSSFLYFLYYLAAATQSILLKGKARPVFLLLCLFGSP